MSLKIFKVFLLVVFSSFSFFLNSGLVSAKQGNVYKSNVIECEAGKYKAKFKLIGKEKGKKVTIKKIRYRFLPETTERNNNKITVKLNQGTAIIPQTIIGCGGKCSQVIQTKVTDWKEILKADQLKRNGKWDDVKTNFTVKKGKEVTLQATFDKPLWDANCDKEVKV